jgi:hypothetical protein
MKNATFVLIALLLVGSQIAMGDDTIRTDKETVRGDIVNMTRTQLDVKDGRTSIVKKIPVNQIVSIRFDDEPDELPDARTQVKSGNFAEAINMLKSIKIEQISRDFVKQEIYFFLAYCIAQEALGGAGDVEEAKEKYVKGYASQYPQNYHYYEVSELYGDLSAAAGDYARAKQAYNAVKQAPWEDAKLRGDLGLARVHYLNGEFKQAASLFEAVRAKGGAGSQAERFRLIATLGKAKSMAADGDGTAGLKMVNGVIRSAEQGDTEVHALAYNAQGDCYRVMKDPKAAVLGYLHVDALYYQHPALHAEALFRIAELWKTMQKPGRETAALKVLKSRYPGSQWAKRAS